jgi:tRNA(His) 5'-end guanylyltransferase
MKLSKDNFGDRMKSYEKQSEVYLQDWIVVRIDGRRFSKFTKGFRKPFDPLLRECMVYATKEAVDAFHANVGYTQSDEITILISPLRHIFSGRAQKISSVVASFVTLKFNEKLNELFDDLVKYPEFESSNFTNPEWLDKKRYVAHFDARAFSVPSDEEAFNVVYWRILDALRNSKTGFAQTYMPHKKLLNKKADEQIELTFNVTGKDWNRVPDEFKYGTLVKRKEFSRNGAFRTKIVEFPAKIEGFSKENVEMIVSRVLESEEDNVQ